MAQHQQQTQSAGSEHEQATVQTPPELTPDNSVVQAGAGLNQPTPETGAGDWVEAAQKMGGLASVLYDALPLPVVLSGWPLLSHVDSFLQWLTQQDAAEVATNMSAANLQQLSGRLFEVGHGMELGASLAVNVGDFSGAPDWTGSVERADEGVVEGRIGYDGQVEVSRGSSGQGCEKQANGELANGMEFGVAAAINARLGLMASVPIDPVALIQVAGLGWLRGGAIPSYAEAIGQCFKRSDFSVEYLEAEASASADAALRLSDLGLDEAEIPFLDALFDTPDYELGRSAALDCGLTYRVDAEGQAVIVEGGGQLKTLAGLSGFGHFAQLQEVFQPGFRMTVRLDHSGTSVQSVTLAGQLPQGPEFESQYASVAGVLSDSRFGMDNVAEVEDPLSATGTTLETLSFGERVGQESLQKIVRRHTLALPPGELDAYAPGIALAVERAAGRSGALASSREIALHVDMSVLALEAAALLGSLRPPPTRSVSDLLQDVIDAWLGRPNAWLSGVDVSALVEMDCRVKGRIDVDTRASAEGEYAETSGKGNAAFTVDMPYEADSLEQDAFFKRATRS